MGQYYKIINITKKEIMKPLEFDNGMKLMEFSYTENNLVLAMANLMKEGGRWFGDKVVVCGDYAEWCTKKEEHNNTYKKALNEICKELGIHGKYYSSGKSKYKKSLYNSTEEFTKISPKDCEYKKLRYIINDNTKEFVDNKHCPIEWAWHYTAKNKKEVFGVTKISPLTLLLAMGNGLGGGDYHKDDDSKVVGLWTKDVGKIRTSNKKPAGYKEVSFDFTEEKELIPYTEEASLIQAEKDKFYAPKF